MPRLSHKFDLVSEAYHPLTPKFTIMIMKLAIPTILFASSALPQSTALNKPSGVSHRALDATTTLSNGASLSSDIATPSFGTEIAVPDDTCVASVSIQAEAAVGEGEPDATYIFVIDTSSSIGSSGLSKVNSFYEGLTDALLANRSTKNVGVVSFASSGTLLTENLIDASTDNAATTIKGSLPSRKGGLTCCGCGLNAAANLLSTSNVDPGSSTTIVFLGDGECNTGPSPGSSSLLDRDDTTIISVAAISVACTAFSEIPGTCVETSDPSELPLADIIGTKLISGTITIGSDIQTTAFGQTVFTESPKTESFEWSNPLGLGTYSVTATVVGDDVLSDQAALSVVDTETNLFTVIDATAPEITCPVDQTISTDPGVCTFTGALPAPSIIDNCDHLSVDPIEGTFDEGSTTLTYETTDNSGNDASCAFDVIVEDTELPTATCEPGPNPSGAEPDADNQDGFFVLGGGDNCGVASIYVVDSVSGTKFGPYPAGTTFKYTIASQAPVKEKDGSGFVDWFLKGNGEGIVEVTDTNGNVAQAVCAKVSARARNLRG